MQLYPSNETVDIFDTSRTEFLSFVTLMRYTHSKVDFGDFTLNYDKLVNAPCGLYLIPHPVCIGFGKAIKSLFYDKFMSDIADDEFLYLNYGLYTNQNGDIVKATDNEFSSISFFSHSGIVSESGELLTSVYKVSKSRCLAFINFLMSCDAFLIM